MGKSFVLKGRGKSPGGYLSQGLNGICCRVQSEEETQVTLLFADGSEMTYTASGRNEYEWPHHGRTLVGAYAVCQGKLVLSSGEDARSAYERKRARALSAERERIAAEADHAQKQEDAVRLHEAEPHKLPSSQPFVHSGKTETHAFPQRRWPPPPCMPLAQYDQGQWREERDNDEKSAPSVLDALM